MSDLIVIVYPTEAKPEEILLGAASGAISGALSDYGVNDDFMKQLSETLKPGNADLFLLIKKFPGTRS